MPRSMYDQRCNASEARTRSTPYHTKYYSIPRHSVHVRWGKQCACVRTRAAMRTDTNEFVCMMYGWVRSNCKQRMLYAAENRHMVACDIFDVSTSYSAFGCMDGEFEFHMEIMTWSEYLFNKKHFPSSSLKLDHFIVEVFAFLRIHGLVGHFLIRFWTA